MNKNEILSEANKLVSNGLRKAAIDLLLEYLETDPNSSAILNTLGRAYLLDHQPEKAVYYLKRSLETSQGIDAYKKPPSKYQAESFSDDDMAYVDSQADTLTEVEYQLETDVADSQAGIKRRTLSPEIMPLPGASQRREKAKIFHEKEGDATVSGNGSQLSLSPVKTSSQLNHPTIAVAYDIPARPVSTQIDDKSVANIEPDTVDAKPRTEKDLPTARNDSISEKNEPLIDPQKEKDDKDLALDDHDDIPWENIEDNGLFENGEIFPNELFDDEADTEDQDDELLEEIEPLIYTPFIEEESDELRWDDFEDLGEFDELAQREVEKDIQDEGKISREERARQVAVLVLEESEWDTEHLPLLQKVFVENGWSAARVAIQREIAKGLLPEELALARKIKRLWSETEQYWITFHKIKTNAHSQQADAAYKQMSWLESLRIIRSFPSLPEIEEIYAFFDEAYDHWYNSNRLRRSFNAFIRYLRYRTGLMRKTLPGDCIYSFHEPVYSNIGVDSEELLNPRSPVCQKLKKFGVPQFVWPKPPENKMKINDEFLTPCESKPTHEPRMQVSTRKQRASRQQREPSFGIDASIALATKGSE